MKAGLVPAGPDGSAGGLAGRAGELAAIDAMLRGTGGHGLLFAGGPGTGKSALLPEGGRAAARAGRTVLRAAGALAETGVPFAGLHQLLYPLAGRFELLAPPQRAALLVAFGEAAGPPPEMFLTGIATLELLAGAAAGAGLLVLADDVHWMDEASTQTLGFVARRIASEPIALLAATRPGMEDALVAAGLPVRVLRPLAPDEAERLIRTRHPGLSQRQRGWVLAQAAGNPLALAELPLAELPAAEATGDPGPAGHLALTTRLERSFAARASDLTGSARSALLVAAADDSADIAEIAAAAEVALPGSGADALRPAVDADLLVVAQATVTFEHPLLRSAVYQSADPALRRRAHAALARVLDGQPERQARHLAAAAVAPEETAAVRRETVPDPGPGRPSGPPAARDLAGREATLARRRR